MLKRININAVCTKTDANHDNHAQVLDYYIYLKVGDGAKLFEQLIVLIRLQIMLKNREGGHRSYIQSGLLQVLIMLYQRQHDLPIWQMLMHDTSMLNEETGEMSFSVLSRCVVGDQNAAKFEYLNKMYILIPAFVQMEDDLTGDLCKTGPKFNWRRKVKPDGEEVQAVGAFIKSMIRAASLNRLNEYDGKNKDSACYKDAIKGGASLRAVSSVTPFWMDDVTAVLHQDLVKARHKTKTNFGSEYRAIWPEMKHDFNHPGARIVRLPRAALPGFVDQEQEDKDQDEGDADYSSDEQKAVATAGGPAFQDAAEPRDGKFGESSDDEDAGSESPLDAAAALALIDGQVGNVSARNDDEDMEDSDADAGSVEGDDSEDIDDVDVDSPRDSNDDDDQGARQDQPRQRKNRGQRLHYDPDMLYGSEFFSKKRKH